MTSRPEILVFCCHPEDVAVLRNASRSQGPVFRAVESLLEVAHLTATRWPAAVFLGVGSRTLAHLDAIPTIRATRGDLSIIVIGEDDSLELERCARQHAIFYYLVHPIDRAEVGAVIKDVLRHAGI